MYMNHTAKQGGGQTVPEAYSSEGVYEGTSLENIHETRLKFVFNKQL